MKNNKSISGQKSIPEENLRELQRIGLVIRELRFNFGLLTQKQLAKKSGVHFNTIQAIEHGDKNYNIMSLMKIIDYFEYDLSTMASELF